MKYKGTLLAVKEIDKSVVFYKTVLGLRVIADFGANKTLTGGIALQTLETWQEFICKKQNEIAFGNNAVEIYFEEDDMDDFVAKLKSMSINYVHELKEHSWGQRVVRLYDLDNHIIEVGENLTSVAKRFLKNGMSVEQVAIRMGISLSYAKQIIK
jgi:catechol 2,3-dioxygenase-like lactoylglutathione lyase family enzyme